MPKFEVGNNKEYEVEAIHNNAIYAKEADGYLLGLYYLVIQKDYPKKENTWKPFSAVIYLQKMVSIFHKNYPEKPTATLVPLDFAPPMAKPIVKLPAKQKQRRLAKNITKRVK